MHDGSSHGSASRERVAENVYRRRTKRGGVVYELVFRDVDGRQKMRKLAAAGERAAVREARAILAGRDGGQRVVAAGLTLDALVQRDYFPMLDSLVSSGRRSERGVEHYRDHYRLHIGPTLGRLRLGDVEPRHVADIVRAMRARPYAESTIDSVLIVLRGIFRIALRRGLASRSPLDGLDPAELPRPTVDPNHGRRLDELELAALVRHARDPYRAVVAVLAFTGLRLSEALGLRWQDVDFVERELQVRGQLSMARRGRPARIIPAKTAASVRVVPLMPAAERALVEQLEQEQEAGRGRDGDFVFLSRLGTPMHQRNVAVRGVEAAAKAAGLGKVTPKDLRASLCSLAGRRGVDPVEAAQITGHSLAVWTKHYARSFGKPQRDEARLRLLAHGFGAASRASWAGPGSDA